MKRLVSWIVMLPFAVAVLVFAATNLTSVTVSLWPLPFEADLPLYLLVLVTFVVGFLVGGIVAWLSGGQARANARRAEARAEQADRQVEFLNKKLARLEDEAKRHSAARENLPVAAGQR